MYLMEAKVLSIISSLLMPCLRPRGVSHDCVCRCAMWGVDGASF